LKTNSTRQTGTNLKVQLTIRKERVTIACAVASIIRGAR
jgi:hypothetical protein